MTTTRRLLHGCFVSSEASEFQTSAAKALTRDVHNHFTRHCLLLAVQSAWARGNLRSGHQGYTDRYSCENSEYEQSCAGSRWPLYAILKSHVYQFLLLSEAGINPKNLIHHRSSKVPKGTDGIGNVRSNQVYEEALSETQLAKHTILVIATSERVQHSASTSFHWTKDN
jgi:hypothetical protein